jgi:hypothetical protein
VRVCAASLGPWQGLVEAGARPEAQPASPAPAAAIIGPAYTTPTTNGTFYLNTSYVNQSVAEAACAANGAHLAAYTSAQEQADVEKHFISNGYLLPAYHRSYWIGYRTKTPGLKLHAFGTVDATLNPARYRLYRWGTYFENGKASPEPNNLMNPEFCATANFSMTFGTPAAWGWADTSCGLRFPFMCRNYSETPGRAGERWRWCLPLLLRAAALGLGSWAAALARSGAGSPSPRRCGPAPPQPLRPPPQRAAPSSTSRRSPTSPTSSTAAPRPTARRRSCA